MSGLGLEASVGISGRAHTDWGAKNWLGHRPVKQGVKAKEQTRPGHAKGSVAKPLSLDNRQLAHSECKPRWQLYSRQGGRYNAKTSAAVATTPTVRSSHTGSTSTRELVGAVAEDVAVTVAVAETAAVAGVGAAAGAVAVAVAASAVVGLNIPFPKN